MIHLTPVFWNTDTNSIWTWNDIISVYTSFSSLPYDHPSVDSLLEDTITQFKRLYRDAEPIVHGWQEYYLDAPYVDTNGYWVQHYIVNAKTGMALISYNYEVCLSIKRMRNAFEEQQIVVNGISSGSSKEAIGNLSGLIEGMKADETISVINWKLGMNSNGTNDWVTKNDLPDLELLLAACVNKQQKLFTTEKYIQEQQVLSPYNSFSDADNAFINYYESL